MNSESVPVISELVIPDLWDYLLGLESKGELEIYLFKDRYKHPMGSDEEIIKTALSRIEKYGEKAVIEIQTYQPHLLEEVLRQQNSR